MPTKFTNAHYYRIAGRYIFGGDLIIVHGAIYFFPEVDLSDQRSQAGEFLPHNWRLVMPALVSVTQKVSLYVSGIDDLSRKGVSDQQFREMADARIEELKWHRKHKGFTQCLPLPTHIKADEISGMRLSPTGKLSFSAQSDNHDFNVGLRRRRRLCDSLCEMDLGGI